MKTAFIAFAMVLSGFTTQAFANTYQLDSNHSNAYLANCGGTVHLERDIFSDELVLSIESLENCSNVTTDGRTEKVDDGWLFGRSADFVINENRGETTFYIHSNSKKTSDTVVVKTRSSGSNNGGHASSYKLNLESCGGTMVARMESSGQVNLIFKGVQQCSNFDILSHNGDSVEYGVKKLQQDSSGNYGGSFTIPNRFKTSFVNGVVIVVKSNSGKHGDRVRVVFN